MVELIFLITLELLYENAYNKLCDNARNVYDRTRSHTVNGQREEYKDVKCLLGDSVPAIRDAMWHNERLCDEMCKATMLYLVNGKLKQFVPEVHRTGQHYDDNVVIMNKCDHMRHAYSQMQVATIMKKTETGLQIVDVVVIDSMRDLARMLDVNERLINGCKRANVLEIDDYIIDFSKVKAIA